MDEYCKPQPPSRHTFNNTNKKPAYRPLWWCACFFCLFVLAATGCGKKKAKLPETNIDSVSFTTLTENVETLISDSGITKYKLKTKLWYTYEEPERKWYFPEGIYLEEFDSLFNVVASVEADTAYYYQTRRLWELRDNVRVMNREGQKFYAVSLFWDEDRQEIYSNEPVRIEREEGELLESQYGFKSNQMMTKYELYSSRGHVNVKDEPMMPDSTSTSSPNDSTMITPPNSSDSISHPKQPNKHKVS